MDIGGDNDATPLIKRDVYDHDKFDIDLLQDVQGMNEMKAQWKFKIETIVATWILFNAISTIMVIIENFRKTVPETRRKEFGQVKFDVLTYSIMYFPVIFFLLLWLLFNNAFSEMTFYMYVRRGAIVDYPESSSPRFLFCHIRPMLFIIAFLGYGGTAVFTMLSFKASIGTIAIFLNNLGIGVGLFWYRQQSIEWKFVSISDFIQAFPDRNNSHGNIDEWSLHRASTLMKDFTLTESAAPSYDGYMRNFYWENKNYGTVARILHHFLYWGVILALAGLSFAYFFVLGRFDLRSRWEAEINPCANSCGQAYVNASISNTITATQCANCVCTCMAAMQARDRSIVDACNDFIQWTVSLNQCKVMTPVQGMTKGDSCPFYEYCGFETIQSIFNGG